MEPAVPQQRTYHCQVVLLALLFVLAAALPVFAENLVQNGDMEEVREVINLWDGVGQSRFIRGFDRQLEALSHAGIVKPGTVPPSVVGAELTSDALPDLLIADTLGYLWLFENSGTANNPKFTNGEIHDVFMSLGAHRLAPRVNFAGFFASDSKDLLLGNYRGEIYLLRDTRERSAVTWEQPATVEASLIPTDSTGKLWGNLLAPAAADFNGDGNLDLVVGDGSYAANTIRLFINQGNNFAPVYNEKQCYALLYGKGREQLVPTIFDTDGDGYPDLIVGDRRGGVTLHQHPGAGWSPGSQFPLSGYLIDSNRESTAAAVAPHAVDMNADGTFDLLLGHADGRVSLTVNTGSASFPEFSEPQYLTGTQVPPVAYSQPIGWEVTTNDRNGNAYAYATAAASAPGGIQPTSGSSMLAAGYLPRASAKLPPFYYSLNGLRDSDETLQFRITTKVPLKNNQIYQLTFQAAGREVIKAGWQVIIDFEKQIGETRLDRKERGIINKLADIHKETFIEDGIFSPRESWMETRSSFTVRFKDADLRREEELPLATLTFLFNLEPGSGQLFIDNVRIVAQ